MEGGFSAHTCRNLRVPSGKGAGRLYQHMFVHCPDKLPAFHSAALSSCCKLGLRWRGSFSHLKLKEAILIREDIICENLFPTRANADLLRSLSLKTACLVKGRWIWLVFWQVCLQMLKDDSAWEGCKSKARTSARSLFSPSAQGVSNSRGFVLCK